MANRIVYEWCLETLDDGGDIVDMDFRDNLIELKVEGDTRLCLVRRVGDYFEGEDDRCWAYVTDEVLPTFFSDEANRQIAIRVPLRFHKEFNINK